MTKILKWISVILAIVAFCMAFTNQLVPNGTIGSFTGEIEFQYVFFDNSKLGETTIVPFIGYCMILLGGLFALVSSLLNEKLGKVTIDIIGAVVAFVGAVLVACMPTLYADANLLAEFFVKTGGEIKLTTTSIVAVLGGFAVTALLAISFVFDLLSRKKRSK